MNSSNVSIFRSHSLVQVLIAIFGSPGPLSTADIIRLSGLPQPLARRELKRLTDAGLLRESRVGRSALFVTDERNPAISHLRALMAIMFGPQT